jgi:shikimate kinase
MIEHADKPASAPPPRQDRNIVLVGMPGVGKSTVGVLLAKAAGLNFLDTDVYIQSYECRTLQAILDTEGLANFCRIEEAYILSLETAASVIATGGSVVYSEPAMLHLQAGGTIVHLDLPLDLLVRRLGNLSARGVVLPPGMDLDDLYRQRQPLYRRWARITVDCAGKSQEQVVEEILAALDGL